MKATNDIPYQVVQTGAAATATGPLVGCHRYSPYDEATVKNVTIPGVDFRISLVDAILRDDFETIPAIRRNVDK